MTGCRISKVRLKAGGAEIQRLPIADRDEAQKCLTSCASMISSHYKPGQMAGYVIFAWDGKGCSSIGYHWNDKSNVRARLIPSFMADALRDRMIEDGDWGAS